MTSRIALLFEYSTLNGGERSMLAALDWLNRRDAELEFVTIAPPTGPLAGALHERQLPLVDWATHDAVGRRFAPEQIEKSLVDIVANLRPQLLHANSLTMGRLLGRVSDQLQIPTTAHLRDIIKLSGAAIADLNRNQRMIAVSHATRDFHVAQGLDESRLTVVRNGLNLEQFRPRAASGRLLAELRINADQLKVDQLTQECGKHDPFKLIATIGQIGLRKGQEVLAAAAPMIVQRIPTAHFVLIGSRMSQKAESVQFETSISEAFARAGLSHHLHCLGYRDDVETLLNEVDILVHPAHQEPFGRVLLEATASGVPIVATNVGGTAEIVDDGETGLLVPPADPESLANAVIRLLDDPSQCQRFGHAGRQKAEREFSISAAAVNLADVWYDVLQKSRNLV